MGWYEWAYLACIFCLTMFCVVSSYHKGKETTRNPEIKELYTDYLFQHSFLWNIWIESYFVLFLNQHFVENYAQDFREHAVSVQAIFYRKQYCHTCIEKKKNSGFNPLKLRWALTWGVLESLGLIYACYEIFITWSEISRPRRFRLFLPLKKANSAGIYRGSAGSSK